MHLIIEDRVLTEFKIAGQLCKTKLWEIPKRFSVCVFKSPSLRRCYLKFENQKTWSNNKNIRICCSKYLMMLTNGMLSTRKMATLPCIITYYAVLTFALNRARSNYWGKNINEFIHLMEFCAIRSSIYFLMVACFKLILQCFNLYWINTYTLYTLMQDAWWF